MTVFVASKQLEILMASSYARLPLAGRSMRVAQRADIRQPIHARSLPP